MAMDLRDSLIRDMKERELLAKVEKYCNIVDELFLACKGGKWEKARDALVSAIGMQSGTKDYTYKNSVEYPKNGIPHKTIGYNKLDIVWENAMEMEHTEKNITLFLEELSDRKSVV